MLSWQGLLICFLFGVLIGMTILTSSLLYTEYKLDREDRKLRQTQGENNGL